MATIYVDNAGSNTSPYDTWAKAATTLQTAFTAWDGTSDVWIASDHSESTGTKFTVTGDNGTTVVRVFSVNSSSDVYEKASAAQITFTTNVSFECFVELNGLYIDCGGYNITTANFGSVSFNGGTIKDAKAVGAADVNRNFLTKNTTFSGTTATVFVGYEDKSIHVAPIVQNYSVGGLCDTGQQGNVRFIGGSFSPGGGSVPLLDLSDQAAYGNSFTMELISPYFDDTYTLTDGATGSMVQGQPFVKVTGGDNYYEVADERGEVAADTGIYYDSGWLDEEDSSRLSYKVTALSTCKEHQHISSDWLQGPYVSTTGSRTITIEAWENHTTALQDDEAWIEILFPSTSGSPALTGFATTQTYTGVQTQADLTAGAGLANWTGETGGVSVKFAKTVTFANAGFFLWRVCLGKYESGKQLNFDPLVVIS